MAYTLKTDVAQKLSTLVPPELYINGQLDLTRLCENLSIPVYDFKFNDGENSGAIVKQGDSWMIFVNSTDSPKRKRFTVAHELGHFISYSVGSESKAELDKHDRIVDSADILYRGQQLTDAELEANEIAGQLLMPEASVLNAIADGMNSEEMAEYFNVSEAAVVVRMRNIEENSVVTK